MAESMPQPYQSEHDGSHKRHAHKAVGDAAMVLQSRNRALE